MYIEYAEFKVLFPNVQLTESDFDIFEAYAEAIVNHYVGKVIRNPGKDVAYATGLIIQYLRGMSLLPQNLTSINAGGINATPNQDFIEYVPKKAKEILDLYRIIDI